MSKFDIAIIGAGPGGYVAAIRASQLGASVALIEKDELGGVCLNRGCIPTKAMIASAHALEAVMHAHEFGVVMPEFDATVDMNAVQSRKGEIVSGLRAGIGKLLKGHGVEVIKGNATFVEGGQLEVDGSKIDAERVMIATGSDWVELSSLPVDGKKIVTSDEALSWNNVPKRLLIVGGGVIGCEFACMMNAFGSEVTIVEAMDRILPPVEGAISRLLVRALKKHGINTITSTMVESARIDGDAVSANLSDGNSIEVDNVLVAVGRRPNTVGLALENAGVELTDRGFIRTDASFKTTKDNIFAIGDIIGPPMLAHAASAHGIAAMDSIFGDGGSFDADVIPSPIFTTPEIGTVGKSAAQLKEEGVEFNTGRFPYAAIGKALCDGAPDGQAIVHAAPDGRVLGVHIIGRDATTIIAEATLAIAKGMSVHDIENTIHSHPTLTEILPEAAADTFGMAIHKVVSRRPRS
jgi:dihydrolipoyl dehydrogenase